WLSWLNVAEIPVDIVQGTLHGTHMTRLARSWPAPAISDINDMAEDVGRLLVTYQTGVVLPRRDHLPDEWPPLRIR
ncbi:hypothetical protein, partial [Catellatospora bangladeshensis]|uniref:hypothetical protein n=1 Tax=Catellatospora bangladeshensis TaxID=310355 RepID=UPI0019428FBB